jgi:hypothetical protein
VSAADAPEPRPPRRPWRRIVLLGLLVLALAGRVALPSFVRSTLERQAAARAAVRLTVGDVDLSLLRGLVAVEDVALHATEAPADAPPLVAWRRFWVNLGWLSLVHRTIRLEEIGLDGLAVNLDRLADGTVFLPRLHPQAEAEPAPASEPWAVVVDRLAFPRGLVRVRDHVARPPETRAFALPSLALTDLRLQPSPDAERGRGRVHIRVGDGEIDVRTRIAALPNGFDLAARVDIARLPLERVHVHAPQLGWSGTEGRLDAVVTARLAPEALPTARGRMGLRDLAITVEGEEEPALAWRLLEVDVERVDLAAQMAVVERVALDGARVLVRPRAPVPLPVVAGLRAARAGEGESTPEEPAGAGAADTARPWRWRVGSVSVTTARAKIFLEPPPLEVEVVEAKVTGLASDPAAEAETHVVLREGEGTVVLDGQVVLDPPGATLAVRLDRLGLGRLVAASGAAPVLLPGGSASGDLRVEARADPLGVEGTFELADLEMKLPEGEDFAVAWKRLGIGIRDLRVPGVLPGGTRAGGGAVTAHLDRIELDRPRVTLTRTADGLVLPAAGEQAAAPAKAAEDAPAATGPGVALTIDRVALRAGEVTVTDRTVTPPYRGRLADMTFDANGLSLAERRIDGLALAFRVGGRAPLRVTSTRRGDGLDVRGTLAGLPLAQFNPYASPFGYRVASGALGLDSRTRWTPEAYESENRVNLDGLVVTGAEGEALFRKQFGISLTVALALLRDLKGRISLGVPIEGDRERGTRLRLGSIVGEALSRAVLGALVSPLKLMGAVRLGRGRIEGFEPAPVAFVPGTTEVAAPARAQVAQLGQTLPRLAGVRLTLRGSAGPLDARAVAEAAVLADLEAERGVVGGLRNLFSGGTRGEIRDALHARARGEPGALEPGAAAELDAWVAEKPVDDGRLRELAAGRARALQDALLGAGAAPPQVALAEPAIDRAAGRSEVTVEIGSTAAPAEPAGEDG